MVHTPSIVLCATIVFSVTSTMAVPIGRLSAREFNEVEAKWIEAFIQGGMGAAANALAAKLSRREEIPE
jgi:hypothetical protein